jgi:hypothetical protein
MSLMVRLRGNLEAGAIGAVKNLDRETQYDFLPNEGREINLAINNGLIVIDGRLGKDLLKLDLDRASEGAQATMTFQQNDGLYLAVHEYTGLRQLGNRDIALNILSQTNPIK